MEIKNPEVSAATNTPEDKTVINDNSYNAKIKSLMRRYISYADSLYGEKRSNFLKSEGGAYHLVKVILRYDLDLIKTNSQIFVFLGDEGACTLDSQQFYDFVVSKSFEHELHALSYANMRVGARFIESLARRNSTSTESFVRVGEKDGNLYLDLLDDKLRAVKITPDGWDIVENYDVMFRRNSSMKGIFIPERNGDVELLRNYINYGSEENFRLILTWIIHTLFPQKLVGSKVILNLSGDQGSSKSTTSRIIRSLIDDSYTPLPSIPNNERDLMIVANTGYYLGLDNVSFITPKVSDSLAKISTGASFAARKLRTDSETIQFSVSAPIILNGISETIINRGDLAERSIIIKLPKLEVKKSDAYLLNNFRSDAPKILGGILDITSKILEILPEIKIDSLPRMSDFARIGIALDEVYPSSYKYYEGFEETYNENLMQSNYDNINNSLLGITIMEYLKVGFNPLDGTPTDVYEQLEDHYTQTHPFVGNEFPRNSISFSKALTRLTPSLEKVGIEVIKSRGKTRYTKLFDKNSAIVEREAINDPVEMAEKIRKFKLKSDLRTKKKKLNS